MSRSSARSASQCGCDALHGEVDAPQAASEGAIIGRMPDGASRPAQERSPASDRMNAPAGSSSAHPDQGIKMTFARQMLALSVAIAVGCGGSAPGGTSVTHPPDAENAPGTDTPAGPRGREGIMHLSGTVRSQFGVRTAPTPEYLAEVKATIDRNHDGAISADETSTAATDGDGAYALDVPVDAGDTLVVRFSDANGAAVLRTVKAAPDGQHGPQRHARAIWKSPFA